MSAAPYMSSRLRHQPRPGRVGLRGVHQQRIRSHAADAHIIDRALRGAELRPRPLPGIAKLDGRRGPGRDGDRDQQHRDRTLDLAALDAEERGGARAVEQHAKVGDVAVGADFLALDVDRADDLVERAVGQVRRLADRRIVHLRPERLEALALGKTPAGDSARSEHRRRRHRRGCRRCRACSSCRAAGCRDHRPPAARKAPPAMPAAARRSRRGRIRRRRSIRAVFWRQRRGNPSGLSLVAARMSEKPLTYADAGVSIDAGNALVKAIAPLARSTARPGAGRRAGRFRRLLRPQGRRIS